jgi:hypothetical protein
LLFALLPDNGSPPDFNKLPSPTGAGIKEPMCSNHPTTDIALAPKKAVTFDDTKEDVKTALSSLATYVHQVFTCPELATLSTISAMAKPGK